MLQDTIKELDKYTKLIRESYIFDEEDAPMDDDFSSEEEIVENPCDATDKINQIRAIALEGIQDFSQNVDSDEYDFFKKVWLMCDKACSTKESNKEEEI